MDDPVLDSVAKSAAFIASVARDVTIDDEALAKVRLTLAQRIGEHGKWSEHPLNPKTRDESTLSWIFLVDTLNFSFWTPSNMQPFVCEGHSGYWSLCAALNRALQEGVEMTSAAVMASLSRAQLALTSFAATAASRPC